MIDSANTKMNTAKNAISVSPPNNMNTNQQQNNNYASPLKAARSLTRFFNVDRADQLGLPSLARQH